MEYEKNHSDKNGADYGANPWLEEGLFANTETDADPDSHPIVLTSPNSVCRSFLRFIERDGKKSDVENFIAESLLAQPKVYASTQEFMEDNPDYEDKLNAALSADEKAALKTYSGYNFAWINSVSRGHWDYEKLGQKTPEREFELKTIIDDIATAIPNAPATNVDFVTFRGTNLDGFRAYGVEDLSQLTKMKGQCMLEQGFTSTALLHEKSFANDETESLWVGKSNIEIRYHIPAGSRDQLAMFCGDLSYSPDQTEILINCDSLFYVSNVSYADLEHVVIDALLIPHDIYEEPGARDRT